jgi:transcriptional regulator with XRE-family HTH domain
MDIGNKIKQLRLRCGLTQEDLGSRCELTKGYISQLENNIASPSISTLEDLLTVLGESLSDFFSDDKNIKVVYKKSDFFEKDSENGNILWLITNSQSNKMEPIIVELPANKSSLVYSPFEGEKFGYLLSGTIKLHVGKNIYNVKKGEAFYFKGDCEHYIENIGSILAKIIWVATPPSF